MLLLVPGLGAEWGGWVLESNPLVSVDREGQASWASPSCHFAVETFNVGGWLAHGDLALEAGVDFLAAVEHGLIPALDAG